MQVLRDNLGGWVCLYCLEDYDTEEEAYKCPCQGASDARRADYLIDRQDAKRKGEY